MNIKKRECKLAKKSINRYIPDSGLNPTIFSEELISSIPEDEYKTMFCPSKTKPWMIGLNAVALLAIIIGMVMVFVNDRDIKNIGAAALSLGVLFGAVGGMMFHHMRQWNLWYYSQKMKSSKELDHEMAEYLKKSESYILFI